MREYEEKDLDIVNEWEDRLSLQGVDGNGDYIYAARSVNIWVLTFRSPRYGKLMYIGSFEDDNDNKRHTFKVVGKDKVLMCDSKGHCLGEGKRGARVKCYMIQFDDGDYVSNGTICGLRSNWCAGNEVWDAIGKVYSWKDGKFQWETCGELRTLWVHQSRWITGKTFWRLCTDEEKQMVKDNSLIKESKVFIRYCE